MYTCKGAAGAIHLWQRPRTRPSGHPATQESTAAIGEAFKATWAAPRRPLPTSRRKMRQNGLTRCCLLKRRSVPCCMIGIMPFSVLATGAPTVGQDGMSPRSGGHSCTSRVPLFSRPSMTPCPRSSISMPPPMWWSAAAARGVWVCSSIWTGGGGCCLRARSSPECPTPDSSSIGMGQAARCARTLLQDRCDRCLMHSRPDVASMRGASRPRQQTPRAASLPSMSRSSCQCPCSSPRASTMPGSSLRFSLKKPTTHW
mmetsp:Transcript_90683/g.240912  ORF Transcript_90683/g.240912 Transcript_90683/m.240912 type:complete len:257 (-) Transcript_90683:460-1230(-)